MVVTFYPGVKVIMDFVPNHSSDEHEWFKKAVDPSDPDHQKYKDYYCWMDSKVPGEQVPPNNWVSPTAANIGNPPPFPAL